MKEVDTWKILEVLSLSDKMKWVEDFIGREGLIENCEDMKKVIEKQCELLLEDFDEMFSRDMLAVNQTEGNYFENTNMVIKFIKSMKDISQETNKTYTSIK